MPNIVFEFEMMGSGSKNKFFSIEDLIFEQSQCMGTNQNCDWIQEMKQIPPHIYETYKEEIKDSYLGDLLYLTVQF